MVNAELVIAIQVRNLQPSENNQIYYSQFT